MKIHLRTDTFKVFAEDDKVLQQIKKDHNLPENNWKSAAIRIALSNYSSVNALQQSFDTLYSAVEVNSAKISELHSFLHRRLS